LPAQITIRRARLHNPNNVTDALPKNQLVVLTGVSCSGKSTLECGDLFGYVYPHPRSLCSHPLSARAQAIRLALLV